MLHTELHAAAHALDPEFHQDLQIYLGKDKEASAARVPAKRPHRAPDQPYSPTEMTALKDTEWDEGGSDSDLSDDEQQQAMPPSEVGEAPPIVQHEVEKGLYAIIEALVPDQVLLKNQSNLNLQLFRTSALRSPQAPYLRGGVAQGSELKRGRVKVKQHEMVGQMVVN